MAGFGKPCDAVDGMIVVGALQKEGDRLRSNQGPRKVTPMHPGRRPITAKLAGHPRIQSAGIPSFGHPTIRVPNYSGTQLKMGDERAQRALSLGPFQFFQRAHPNRFGPRQSFGDFGIFAVPDRQILDLLIRIKRRISELFRQLGLHLL